MRELELDGIHDDDERVILIDTDGDTYTLRIDEALRAAVRRDRPALGAIRATEATPLRPREIQAMLRSGRTVAEISEIAKVPADHVRRYEGPVRAEREYLAARARSFYVGRGGPSLGQAVSERLAARQADDDVRWDAWRRPDGTWTLELVFSAGGRERVAHWVVDTVRQSVVADDDEGRWLTDDDAHTAEPGGRARLTSIKSSVYDLEADGSLEGPPERSRPRSVPRSRREDPQREHPAAIEPEHLDALNARRGLRSVPAPESSVWETLDTEAPSGAADDEAAADHQRETTDAEEDAQESWGDQAEWVAGDEDDGDAAARSEEAQPSEHDTVDLTPLPGFDQQEEPATKPAATSKQSKRGSAKRSSVPSWDEIVFGSKQD